MAEDKRLEADGIEPYDFLSCTHTSLRRAARQLTQVYDDALAPSGMTSSQAALMGQLDSLSAMADGAGPSLQVLSKRLAIQLSALTHALRPLVRDGLVALVVDGSDRRIKRAVMTEKGRQQTDQMYVLWVETNRRIEAVLGGGSTEQLRLLANKVASPDFVEAYEKQAG